MPLIWTLRDTFTDGTVDPVKWLNNYNSGLGGPPVETGGRARVWCTTGYAAFASAAAWTLDESSTWVRIFPPADGGAATEAFAQLLVTSVTAGTDAMIEVNAATGLLGMAVRVGYFDPNLVTITYDPDAHAWVRIRETAGTLYWETSYEGRIWTIRRTATSPSWVGDATLQVQLLSHRDSGTSDFAEFDNFNVDKTAVLTDNFNAGTVDTVKWPGSFGTYTQTGGRAQVACDTGFSAYASGAVYTLEGSYAGCQVFPPAAGGAAVDAWAQMVVTSSTGGTDAVMEVNAVTGMLKMLVRVGYTDPSPVLLPYDPVLHAWLRIREEAGSLLWESSGDGVTWVQQRTAVSPSWVSATDLQVQLVAHRDSGTPDVAAFDNVNVAPFAQLTDNFNSPAVDTVKWPDNYNEDPGGPDPDQPDGRARVPCANTFAAYASAAVYTLSASQAAVQVFPPAVGGATGSVFCQFLILSSISGTQIIFEVDVSANLLLMTLHVDFTDEGGASLPYDPAQHAWLRVREAGGSLFWETSPDGRAWTVQHTDTAPAWVSENNLQVQMLAYRDNGAPDFAEFDNLNITPVLLDGYTVAIDWNSDGSFDGPYDDVTDDVLQRGPVVFQYGRDQDRQLAPPAVASMTMTLCNADRIYSPENPSSPIADELSPAAPVKVETNYNDVLYPLFPGRIDDFEVHPDRGDRSADINVVGLLSLLQGVKISTVLFEAHRTGALMHIVLNEVGWTGPRDIDPGATHVPWWWLEEADAFTAMTDLLASEGPPSVAYVGPDGTFIFRDRHHRLLRQASLVPQAEFASERDDVCGDHGDDCPGFGECGFGEGEFGG